MKSILLSVVVAAQAPRADRLTDFTLMVETEAEWEPWSLKWGSCQNLTKCIKQLLALVVIQMAGQHRSWGILPTAAFMAVEAKAQGAQIIPAMITATPQHQAQQDLSRYLGPLQQQCLMEELVAAEDHNGNIIINMAVL